MKNILILALTGLAFPSTPQSTTCEGCDASFQVTNGSMNPTPGWTIGVNLNGSIGSMGGKCAPPSNPEPEDPDCVGTDCTIKTRVSASIPVGVSLAEIHYQEQQIEPDEEEPSDTRKVDTNGTHPKDFELNIGCGGKYVQSFELWEKDAPPLSGPHDFVETEVACSKCQPQEN